MLLPNDRLGHIGKSLAFLKQVNGNPSQTILLIRLRQPEYICINTYLVFTFEAIMKELLRLLEFAPFFFVDGTRFSQDALVRGQCPHI